MSKPGPSSFITGLEAVEEDGEESEQDSDVDDDQPVDERGYRLVSGSSKLRETSDDEVEEAVVIVQSQEKVRSCKSKRANKRKKDVEDPKTALLIECKKALTNTNQSDEHDTYGAYVANSLRNLTSKVNRNKMMRDINMIIYKYNLLENPDDDVLEILSQAEK
jgi:predicted SPOUT superfamily RNA methylase MTH1